MFLIQKNQAYKALLAMTNLFSRETKDDLSKQLESMDGKVKKAYKKRVSKLLLQLL